MAFVRKKTIKRTYNREREWGKNRYESEAGEVAKTYEYYYLVESVREGDKVKQKTIVSLLYYPTIEEAATAFTEIMNWNREVAENYHKKSGPPPHYRKQRIWAEAAKEHAKWAAEYERRLNILQDYM